MKKSSAGSRTSSNTFNRILTCLIPIAFVLTVGACGTPGSDAGSAERQSSGQSESAESSEPSGSASASGGQLATSVLETLPVKGRAPKTGYSRDQFGAAWADVDHNGCDTRNDILNRDLTNKTYKAGTHNCVVTSGRLVDPYTAAVIDFVRGQSTSAAVQIDHVVALSDAWQKGAQQLIADRRKQLANDPYNLLAVDGPSNQRKSDGDAATWLPANKSFRCSYVARQIGVKAKYSLWVTQAEHDAMSRVLSSCPVQTVPTGDGAESVAPQEDVSQGSSSQDGSSGEQSESSTVVEPAAPSDGDSSDVYYKNCAAVRAAGRAPLYKGQPGYYQTRSRRRRRRLRIAPHLHPAKVPSAAAGMGLLPSDGFAAPPCPHCSRCFPYSDGIYYCVFGIGMRREGAGRKTPACGAEGEQSDGRASWSGQFRGRAASERECRVP